jgi:hypothetical protein
MKGVATRRALCNFCRWVQRRDEDGFLVAWDCAVCGAETVLEKNFPVYVNKLGRKPERNEANA